jgi:hypothetical protein
LVDEVQRGYGTLFEPTADNNEAIPRINANENALWAPSIERRLKESWLVECSRAKNRSCDPDSKRSFEVCQGSQTATNLDRTIHTSDHRMNEVQLHGATSNRTIKIDNVQQRRTTFSPVSSDRYRIIAIDSFPSKVSLD